MATFFGVPFLPKSFKVAKKGGRRATLSGGFLLDAQQDLREAAMEPNVFIAIGSSAGGVPAVSALLNRLPADLPAPIFVVVHSLPGMLGTLVKRLGQDSPLRVTFAKSGEKIRTGHVYVAPPDVHLLVERPPGRVVLSHAPRESGVRPSVDMLFRSAANAYGPRAVGVVMSGRLCDGAAGLLAIKAAGGVALVQDPKEATHPGMPQSVLDAVQVDAILRIADLGEKLDALSRKDAAQLPAALNPPDENGNELTLALWTALQTLEEKAALVQRLADTSQGRVRARFVNDAEDLRQKIELIRRQLRLDSFVVKKGS